MSRRRLSQAERQSIRRNKRIKALCDQTNLIERGACDHLFANAEAKAFLLADIKAEANGLIEEELTAFPGIYKRLPNGSWALCEEGENVTPYPRPGK